MKQRFATDSYLLAHSPQLFKQGRKPDKKSPLSLDRKEMILPDTIGAGFSMIILSIDFTDDLRIE